MTQTLPAMNGFFLYEAKAGVLLAVFFLLYRVLLGRVTLYSLRRWILLASLAASFILPLVVITLYRSADPATATALPPSGPSDPAAPTTAGQMGTAAFPWETVLCVLLLAGGAALAVGMGISALRIYSIIRNGERATAGDGTPVILTTEGIAPFSWFGHIVLTREDLEDPYGHILLHEKSHVLHHHALDNLFAAVLTCLQWFNPAIWLLRREIREVHEFQADSDVLRAGADPFRYRYALVAKAASASGLTITDGFSKNTLKHRIDMMTRKRSPRISALRALYMLPLLALALTLNARTVIRYDTPPSRDEVNTPSYILLEEIVAVSYDITPPSEELPYRKPDHALPSRAVAASSLDEMPLFEGKDLTKASAWANMRVARPAGCNHTGRAEVEFILEADGSLGDIRTVGGICPEIASHLEGVISRSSGKWTPARKGGKPVATMLVLPLRFMERKSTTQEPSKTAQKPARPSFYGGGLKKFALWVDKNKDYPREAKEKNIQGEVLVTFVIDEAGHLTDARVVKGVDPLLDAEALRVVKSSPDWTPATKEGTPTKATLTCPVVFRLAGDGAQAKPRDKEVDLGPSPMEVKPRFGEGGIEDFSKWVNDNLNYPEEAVAKKLQGRIVTSFAIDEQGHVTDAKVIRGIDPLLDAEVLRVLNSSPDWTPGMQDGKPVKVTFIFPVIFSSQG